MMPNITVSCRYVKELTCAGEFIEGEGNQEEARLFPLGGMRSGAVSRTLPGEAEADQPAMRNVPVAAARPKDLPGLGIPERSPGEEGDATADEEEPGRFTTHLAVGVGDCQNSGTPVDAWSQ